MPDLNQIKQGEQGARGAARLARFQLGREIAGQRAATRQSSVGRGEKC